MKNRVAVVLMFLALQLTAQDNLSSLTFNSLGFSISPLEGTTKDNYVVLVLLLPATEAFAPNVNVMLQPYKGTIAEYYKISLMQYDQQGTKILSYKVIDSKILIIETVDKDGLQYYARAEILKGKVYLVTATATQNQWKTYGDQLRVCVNSFRLLE